MSNHNQNRVSLKEHFKAGSLPTQKDFADLIDSCLNLSEDGFSRTDRDGWHVHSQAQHDGLFSYHRDGALSDVLWSTGFAKGNDNWVMRPGDVEQAAALTLDRKGNAGIGVAAPQVRLDVAGTVRASGRLGTAPEPLDSHKPLVADGEWKDLTGDLQGCQGFEIMAGTGRPDGLGHFALLHATAFNCYHPVWWQNLLGDKRPIRAQHAYYGRRRNRLQLRWWSPNDSHGHDATYRLQIRSRADYVGHLRPKADKLPPEKEVQLYVYLTQLWFQPRMGPLAFRPETDQP